MEEVHGPQVFPTTDGEEAIPDQLEYVQHGTS